MDIELLKKELTFRTSRSGGSGGQNVNKVETKVEAMLDLNASLALTSDEKVLVFDRLANQITQFGVLQVVNQTERTQLANRQLAVKRLVKLVQKSLIQEKIRLKKPVPKSVVEARLNEKQHHATKKQTRKKVNTANDVDLFFIQ